MAEYKIRKLNAAQTGALLAGAELVPPEGLSVTATTATFRMEDPAEWLNEIMRTFAKRDGRRGGHYQALHAVKRKLDEALAERRMVGEQPPAGMIPESLSELLRF